MSLRRFCLDQYPPDPTLGTPEGVAEVIAEGGMASDGTTVLHWLVPPYSTTVFASIAGVEALCTAEISLRWEDPICTACGEVLMPPEQQRRACASCGEPQRGALWYETRPPGEA